jgi:hypothetical protein
MAYKRKISTEEEMLHELVQDTDSDCDSELEEFLRPNEEGDEVCEVAPPPVCEVAPPPGNEPGTHGEHIEKEDEYGPGPSGKKWGSKSSKLSPLKFTGKPRGVREEETPSINKDSTPFSFLMLYFAAIVPLLVEQTNLYYKQYFDRQDDDGASSSPLPDVTLAEMYLFLALIVQMGHDIRDTLKDYWSTLEQFHTPFLAIQ